MTPKHSATTTRKLSNTASPGPLTRIAQTVRPHSPLWTPGGPQGRHPMGALPPTPRWARRRATGRAHLARPAPRMDRARPALLPSVPGPFDTATAGGNDNRSGPSASAAGCVWRSRFLMNAAEVTHGNAKRKLLEPAASPLPFAGRAGRSTPLLSTCLRPAGAGDSNQSTQLPLRTRLLPASLLAPGQP